MTTTQLLIFVVLGLMVDVAVNAFNSFVSRRDNREMRQIAVDTHAIVNSQRSTMLRLIAQLSQRIARDNPDDARAQADAEAALIDSSMADKLRR